MPSEQQLLAQLNAAQPMAEQGPDWWRVIFSLLLVLGLVVWVLRQVRPWLQAQKGLASAVPDDKRIILHHAVRLGGGHSLHTLSVNGQVYLVGTGPAGSPNLIDKI